MINKDSFKSSSISSPFEEDFFNSNETYIHPSAVIDNNVKLGSNVKIGPFCVISGNVTIDDGTKIFPYVSIGLSAQDTGTAKALGKVYIGKNCSIREFVTIHAPKKPDGSTTIGNNCYIMNFSHVSHDATLGDNVILINSVNLGGHTHIENNVMLMASAAAHQFCRIGRFSCLTPFSGIRQDLPPFCMFTGQPAKFSGLNLVALKRAGFSKENIQNIKHVAKLYFQDKLSIEEIFTLSKSESWGTDLYTQEFLEFIKNSSRGVSRRCISYGSNDYY